MKSALQYSNVKSNNISLFLVPSIDVLLVGSSNIRRWIFPGHNKNKNKSVNLGISRALTSSLLTDSYFHDMRQYCPKNVIYMCGNNDLRAGIPSHTISQNILQFIIHMRTIFLSCNMSPRIIVCSLLDTPDIPDIDVHTVNREIYEYINKFGPQVVYVDINSDLSSDDFVDNGIHLNDRGYSKVYNTLVPYLV